MTDVSCPVGGLSYTCATITPSFLGCCDINPCHNSNCPSASLFPMGLGDCYTYVPDHSCPNGGQWWTCAQQTPTFQGCCATDSCNGVGCPALIAAGLGPDASQNALASAASQCGSESSVSAEEDAGPTSQSIASTSTPGTSSATSNSPYNIPNTTISTDKTITLSAARDASASATPTPRPSNTGTIVEGAAASFLIITLIATFVFWLVHRKSKPNTRHGCEESVYPTYPAYSPREFMYEDKQAAVEVHPAYASRPSTTTVDGKEHGGSSVNGTGFSNLHHSPTPPLELSDQQIRRGNSRGYKFPSDTVSPQLTPGVWNSSHSPSLRKSFVDELLGRWSAGGGVGINRL